MPWNALIFWKGMANNLYIFSKDRQERGVKNEKFV
jgi:hypothetical protein